MVYREDVLSWKSFVMDNSTLSFLFIFFLKFASSSLCFEGFRCSLWHQPIPCPLIGCSSNGDSSDGPTCDMLRCQSSAGDGLLCDCPFSKSSFFFILWFILMLVAQSGITRLARPFPLASTVFSTALLSFFLCFLIFWTLILTYNSFNYPTK